MANEQTRILLVEDNPVQATALAQYLEHNGAQVLKASNGQAGIEIARQQRPAAIILDVQMPVMGGLEACRLLKAEPDTADIPIIILTVHDEADNLQQGADLGAVDFIPKDAFLYPVILETLRQLQVLPAGQEGA